MQTLRLSTDSYCIVSMTLDEFAPRLVGFIIFMANIVVCSAAARFYQKRSLRSVLLIAVSSGLAALVTVLSWAVDEPTYSSLGFWWLTNLITVADIVMWAIGSCWFFREYERRDSARAA